MTEEWLDELLAEKCGDAALAAAVPALVAEVRRLREEVAHLEASWRTAEEATNYWHKIAKHHRASAPSYPDSDGNA